VGDGGTGIAVKKSVPVADVETVTGGAVGAAAAVAAATIVGDKAPREEEGVVGRDGAVGELPAEVLVVTGENGDCKQRFTIGTSSASGSSALLAAVVSMAGPWPTSWICAKVRS
jgi:hypothetical protein